MLVGEELAGPSIAGLDFVQNQHSAVFRTQPAQLVQKTVCRFVDSGNTLDTFYYHPCIQT